MSVIDKYNKGTRFNIDTKDFKFYKLKEIYDVKNPDKEYDLKGVAIFNSGKYGDSAVAILNDCFVNLPSHMNEDVKEMLHDDDFINAVNSDKIAFTIRTYLDDKHGKGTCYSVTWIEKD